MRSRGAAAGTNLFTVALCIGKGPPRLKPLIRKTQPYAKKIAHPGICVEPSVLTEIEYRAKSAVGKVRHPFFKGLREDL